jgi:short-subunit dehydrogenase
VFIDGSADMPAISEPQRVLITGASGAIGGALALEYAAPGRSLVLHGRNAERLKRISEACESRGARTETRIMDVRDTATLTSWIDEVQQHQLVDLAILNAGTINVLRPGDASEAWSDVERVVDVNARATFAAAAALVPHMRRRGSGQIALMSSLTAWYSLPVAPAYSASKAALKSYGDMLRWMLADEGIRISVVLPGFVKSDMSDELRVPRLFMVTAEDAARRIRRGLEKDRARIAFPLPLAVAGGPFAALPSGVQRWMLSLLGFDRR